MKISFSKHDSKINESLRIYAVKKMDRILRHFDKLIDIHCNLSVSKNLYKAEATLKVPGNSIHAESVANEMHVAIDLLADKIDRLVKKRKEKNSKHHAKEGRDARH